MLLPNGVANLEVWFRADAGLLTSGSNVTGWNDSSGNGRNITSVSSTKPTVNSSFSGAKPSVSLSHANATFLKTAAFGSPFAQGYTVFLVGRHTGIGTVQYFADGLTGSHRATFAYNSNVDCENFSGLSFHTTVAGNSLESPFIWTCQFNGASTKSRINNGLGATLQTGNAGTQSLDGVTLGSRFSSDFNVDGDIAEYILYSRLLNASEVGIVESYLSTKYQIKANYLVADVFAGAELDPNYTLEKFTGAHLFGQADMRGRLNILRSIFTTMSGSADVEAFLFALINCESVMVGHADLIATLDKVAFDPKTFPCPPSTVVQIYDPIAAAIRARVHHIVGDRNYRVFLVRRGWSGNSFDRGDFTGASTARVELRCGITSDGTIVPPRVKWKLPYDAAIQGVRESGIANVSDLDPTQMEVIFEDFERLKSGEESYFEILDDRRDGLGIEVPVRRFRLSKPPYRDAKNFQWRLDLESQDLSNPLGSQ